MTEKNTFAERLALLCYSNLGLTVLGFFYRIFLSRMAGAEGLGVYRLVFSVYAVIHATSLAGVSMACTRLSATWMAQGKLHAVRHLVRLAFGTFGVIFGGCALLLLGFGEWIGTVLLGDGRTLGAMPVLLLCIALTGIENVYKSTMIGLERVDNAALSELLEQIIRIGATMALLYAFPHADLGWIAVLIFAGMVISECVSATTMTVLYHRLRLQPGTPPPAGFRKAFFAIVLPISGNALLINAVASADAVILPERLVHAGLAYEDALAQMGMVSGIASPILFLPMALVASLATVALPEISRLHALGDATRTAQFAQRTLWGAGLVGIPATAILLPLSPIISRLFFFEAVDLSVFCLLALSVCLLYYQMLTACLLNGTGHQKFTVSIALTSEILQLGLVWWLAGLPAFGIYGYLIAMVVAPLYVVLCNLGKLYALGILQAKLSQLFALPLLCGVTLLLWTRIFFSFGLDWLGGQWQALSLALVGAGVLYALLLRAFGIPIKRYLTVRARDRANMFWMY